MKNLLKWGFTPNPKRRVHQIRRDIRDVFFLCIREGDRKGGRAGGEEEERTDGRKEKRKKEEGGREGN